LPEVERRLNWRAVGHLFATRCTPPLESIIAGVQKLAPGHLLQVEAGRSIRPERYWNIVFAPDRTRNELEVVAQLRDELEESVRLHLVSDVPLGAFLSGGIDSSAVVAAMTHLTSGPVKTFTVGFSDPDYDELRYARMVAEHFGTEHHELILEPDALGILDDLV